MDRRDEPDVSLLAHDLVETIIGEPLAVSTEEPSSKPDEQPSVEPTRTPDKPPTV